MSTRTGYGDRLRAADIRLGDIYSTRIATGDVIGRVTARVPADARSRNERFHLVDVATGACLPRLKRAEDLSRGARS